MKKILCRVFISFLFIFSTSYGLSKSNGIAVYLLYFSPLALFLSIILIYFHTRVSKKAKQCLVYPILCLGFFCLPIFFGVFFGLFHPLYSLRFEQIQECNVVGIAPMGKSQLYTILYVDFVYKSHTHLGYACISKYQLSDIQNYDFSENNVSMRCNKIHQSYDFEKDDRLLEEKGNNERFLSQTRGRLLKKKGPCKKRRKNGYLSYYQFSKQKIPNFLCGEYDIDFDELVKTKKCYVHFYGDAEKSYQNSKDRLNLKEIKNIALTTFQQPPLFSQAGYFCLIVFTYIPFLLLYFPLSIFLTKQIFRVIRYIRNKF